MISPCWYKRFQAQKDGLSNVLTHKVACIFAPIDNPKTAESKQSKIAGTYNISYTLYSITHIAEKIFIAGFGISSILPKRILLAKESNMAPINIFVYFPMTAPEYLR